MSKPYLEPTLPICDCFEEADTAIAYMADTLSPEEAEAYEQHYFLCTRCFTALEAVRAAKQSLAASKLIAMPTRRKFTL